MRVAFDYDVEIDRPGFLTPKEIKEAQQKLESAGISGVGGWAQEPNTFRKDHRTIFTLSDDDVGDFDEVARGIAKHVFRILGPCEISFNCWYKDRDPDDYAHYDAEDYSDLIAPLEQLALASDE